MLVYCCFGIVFIHVTVSIASINFIILIITVHIVNFVFILLQNASLMDLTFSFDTHKITSVAVADTSSSTDASEFNRWFWSVINFFRRT